MGGVILVGLLVVAVVILILPALRAREESRKTDYRREAHEAVVRKLNDHRRDNDAENDEGGTDSRLRLRFWFEVFEVPRRPVFACFRGRAK